MRVAVAMSGGVDSSVAAGLMLEAGHEVVGLTMKLRDTAPTEAPGASCCSPDDLRDARRVCDRLGIPHYVIDYRDAFKQQVMKPFAEAYLEGRTPNPCVLCNDHVKFDTLIARARALGAQKLVTGHYARIEDAANGPVLLRGVDRSKDQSYFLFGMTADALSFTWFPLGGVEKTDARDTARAQGLHNWDKPDSEDICFVPDGDYARVVERILGADRVPKPGVIRDPAGVALGQHGGVHNFTVGQRKGLGIAATERLYVLSVDGPTREVIVGRPEALLASGLTASRCNWIGGPPADGLKVEAKIRYGHAGVGATLRVVDDGVEVHFDTPQRAVAPGQAVVFYDGERVVGGGWIDRALAQDEIERQR